MNEKTGNEPKRTAPKRNMPRQARITQKQLDDMARNKEARKARKRKPDPQTQIPMMGLGILLALVLILTGNPSLKAQSRETLEKALPNCRFGPQQVPLGGPFGELCKPFWRRVEASNGEVSWINVKEHPSGIGNFFWVYTSVPDTPLDPNAMRVLEFDCQGHFASWDVGPSALMDAPPRSVAGELAAIVCPDIERARAAAQAKQDPAIQLMHQDSILDNQCRGGDSNACGKQRTIVSQLKARGLCPSTYQGDRAWTDCPAANQGSPSPAAPPNTAPPARLLNTPAPNAIAGATGTTQVGLAFNDAGMSDFGSRFPWYVTAVQRRISSNWLQSTIDPTLSWAPRVVVTFDILRNGTVMNIQITRSSNNYSVDSSAMSAVQQSSPLMPLPPAYGGSRVSVEFYFDYRHAVTEPPPNQLGAAEAKSENPLAEIAAGQTAAEVMAILGPPTSITRGPIEVYNYSHLSILFVRGKVWEIHRFQ